MKQPYRQSRQSNSLFAPLFTQRSLNLTIPLPRVLFALCMMGVFSNSQSSFASTCDHLLIGGELSADKSSSNNTTSNNTTSNSTTSVNPRFESLKNRIFDKPYLKLPQYKVDKRAFGPEKNIDKNKLLQAAKRTFSSSDDLVELPTEHKLLNANGICFSGTWQINQESEYTGVYKKGSCVSTIVRASVALSDTTQRNKRAFGMAIKLFPDDLGDEPSLNAFVLHSMGGTVTKHVLDLKLDNEPPLGRLPKITDLFTALRLQRDLERADEEFGATTPDATFRPVSTFAKYNSQNPVSPRWLRLSALDAQRVDHDDFRDELNIKNYSDGSIRYQIEVAGNDNEPGKKKEDAQWQHIGILELTQSVVSPTCDLNLHFQHPKLE